RPYRGQAHHPRAGNPDRRTGPSRRPQAAPGLDRLRSTRLAAPGKRHSKRTGSKLMANNRAQILISAVDQTRGAFDSIKRNLGDLGNAARSLKGVLGTLGVALSAAGL